MVQQLVVQTRGQGLYEFTDRVEAIITASGVSEGLCTVFVQHTSASLTIQENADPSAKHDLEQWLSRLVREDDPHFTHTSEGPDDMPSHIKAALTATSLAIPVMDGKPALGTWQGVYLWEHRHRGHARRVIVQVA